MGARPLERRFCLFPAAGKQKISNFISVSC
jgi:hypothetical protein